MSKLSLTNQYQTYPKYKKIELEEEISVPFSWNIERLSRLGYVPKERSAEGELLSVYLDRGVIKASDGSLGTHPAGDDLSNYQIVKKGDLILNNQQAWRGSVAVSELNGIISPAYILFRFKEEMYPRFFNYLCRSNLIVDQFRLHSKGVGNIQRQIHSSALKKVKVVVPPKEEQEKIAKFLDAQVERIDTTIAKKQRLIELLKEKRTTTINHAVTKGLDPNTELVDSGIDWIGKIPKGWEVKKLKFVTKMNYGDSLSADSREEGEIPVFGSNGMVGTHNVANTQGKTILIGRKGSFGAVSLSQTSAFAIDTVYYVDMNCTAMDLDWLFFVLKAANLSDVSLDTGVPGLSRDAAYQKYLPVPDNQVQKQIAERLKSATERFDTSIEKVDSSIKLLQEFKFSLISHAVTGKIKI